MKNGEKNGKGKMTWTADPSKGDIYEGEWKDDNMHGKGIYKFHGGKIYSGEWYCGDMHGQGIMKYNDGFYEGEFIHDKREGKGKKTWTDGPSKGDVYDGEWKNDKMHGKGIYKYHNGKEYNGE